ncbi:DNA-binding MarR family transcriptional regulator [Rhodoligotrophos appendicifer]|uniref:MarR family winged helix-turn-helix transcriptional regulator n=1 Tax=Rhodoligotrophos appendicifer TaxID=987056 RepID=UPI001186F90A|nr:MarR family transcriptional regulator [Rhodoligotrophos appendicifer]
MKLETLDPVLSPEVGGAFLSSSLISGATFQKINTLQEELSEKNSKFILVVIDSLSAGPESTGNKKDRYENDFEIVVISGKNQLDATLRLLAEEKSNNDSKFEVVSREELPAKIKTLRAARLADERLRTVRLIDRVCQQVARDRDWLILASIYGRDPQGLSLTRLSSESGISLSTLWRGLERLRARRLVVMKSTQDDRRVREVALTASGQKAVERVFFADQPA